MKRKLNLLYGNNTLSLFKETINRLRPFLLDLSTENFVIVPDRLSLITEQQIFELLGIESYFNISVMGISKFARMILEESGLGFVECTNLESKIILLKAIQNVSDEFVCFSKNYTLGFVDEIYAKIEQIKSSRVDINDINPQQNEKNISKFKDIALIFEEYERLRGNKLDSGDLLELFSSISSNSDTLKNCNVFFAGFDSMTRQGVMVVKNVVLNAKNVYLALTVPCNQNNYKIYDESFRDSVLKMCETAEFEFKPQWIKEIYLNKNANIILNNIFSREKNFDNIDYIKIYKNINVENEINFAIKSINFLIKKDDLSFKDIAICAPTSYHEKLKAKLIALGIDAYTDTKSSLSDLEPIKLILAFMKFLDDGNIENLKAYILNDFLEISIDKKEKLICLLNKYNSLNAIIKFEKNIDKEIIDFIENVNEWIKIPRNDVFENYVDLIEKLIKNSHLFENIDNFCVNLQNSGKIQLEKLYRQVNKKVEEFLHELKNIKIFEKIDFSDFVEICQKSFDELTILGIPSGVNQIFIGDYKSFFNEPKILYILGMNEGESPEILTDTGLITDKEIIQQEVEKRLEPTTKIINKRNKLKMLEVILSAKEKCYLYYHQKDEEDKISEPSEIITELVETFNIAPIDTTSLQTMDDSCIEINKLCLNSMDTYNANIFCKFNDGCLKGILKNALISQNKYFIHCKSRYKFTNFKELFLKNNKVSVSLVEKYNNCPRAAFLANGLKLQKVEKEKTEANVIGTFIHEIGERFVKNENNLGYLSFDEIKSKVIAFCNTALQDEKYYTLKLDENKFLLKMLKDECVRFCEFLNYEQSVSSFKPLYTEKYFGPNSGFKPIEIEIEGEKFTISGIVDRIDVFDENFRIIDYKTGNTTNKNGKENLYFGKKIQLFIYARAISKNLDKKMFGVFYLPIQNNFSPVDDSGYNLSGFFINSYYLAKNCDKNFGLENKKSKILDITLLTSKKSEEVKLRKKVNLLSEEEINAYCDYAIEMVKNTVVNMVNGYVKCSPLPKACEFCEFNEICEMANDKKIVRTEDFNVTAEKIVEICKNGEKFN